VTADVDDGGTIGTGPRDPEQLEATATVARPVIDAATTIGPVHLTVSSLERSLAYYYHAIGLDVLARTSPKASLGAGTAELLVVTEEPGAPPAHRHTGLYHVALLLPTRAELARWLAHAAHDRVALLGLSDHVVGEAVYLTDPDGHGLEIYADRPRDAWEGRVDEHLTTLPLDVESLLRELDDVDASTYGGLPPATSVGHVHLRVAEIESTITFYRDVLGFGLMAQLGPRAAFLAAGGYHHHIGANTWESAGAQPPPPGSAALRHATLVLPSDEERERVGARCEAAGIRLVATEHGPVVDDPSGNRLVLAVA
jgi:catechol 2,3-dioxygenase